MKTVAIISQKGGSGKTTIAVHLAVCAELHGQPTLILDLDPQASACSWLARRGEDTPEVIAAEPNGIEVVINMTEGQQQHVIRKNTKQPRSNAGRS